MDIFRNGIRKAIPTAIFLFSLIFSSTTVFAQTPTDQDCLGAITVCQSVYSQLNSYSGTGNYPNEIPTTGSCPGNCLSSGEKNDVWYIFTVNTGGDLGFKITPNNQNDDYDWAVYSLNEYDCEDIYTHAAQMQVSCNYSGTSGITGATLVSGNNCEGAGGPNKCKFIPVETGDVYVLNISNYSSSQSGYTLDFGLSTANIYDNIPPAIDSIYTDGIQCGTESLDFAFNERVLCNSVQASDFELTGPGGPYTITDLYGETCDQGGDAESHFTIYFEPPIYESGTYSLNIQPMSFIKDDCGNTAFVGSYEFDISLNSPDIDAGEDQNIPYAATTQLDGTVTGGSGNFVFDWQPEAKLVDNTVEDPTTIALTETTLYSVMVEDESNNCRSTDEVTVNIVGGPMSVMILADNTSVCSGDPAVIEAIPSGGGGSYTYIWTSDPSGINYTSSSITVYPEVTTTYFLEVTDGYTTLFDEITITVYPTPIANAGPEQEINMGTFTYLEGSANNGQSPYSYNWSPPDFIDGDITVASPKTTILEANQIYLLNIVDDNGCIGESSEVLVKVTGSALGAQPVAYPTEICIGQSATLTSNVSGGGGGPYTMEWRTEDGSWSQTGDNVTVSPEEDTKYFLLIDDGFTYVDSIPLYLPVNPLPEINLIPAGYPVSGDTISVCVRDTVIIDAGNDNNPNDMAYLWSNGWGERYLTTLTNGNFFDLQTFSVNVSNTLTGCADSSTIAIMFDFTECGLGVEENESVYQPVKIVPNPNNGEFKLTASQTIELLEIELLSLQGKTIYSNQFNNIDASSWESEIDLRSISSGTYILKYKVDSVTYSQKFIKR